MSQRHIITLLTLSFILLAFAITRIADLSPIGNENANSLSALLPDFIIEDFNSQQFTADGKLQYEMEAKKLTHYPVNDVTELAFPMLDFNSASQGRWTVKSKRGFVASQGDMVELKGDVTLERLTTERPTTAAISDSDPEQNETSIRHTPIKMDTDTLLIHLDKEFAETTHPVIITATNSIVTAIGLQADFANNRLTLVSSVRGRHEIQKK